MAITLKQFEGATVSPKDDAIMYDQMSTDYGIISGLEINILSTNIVSISAGYALIKGRLVQIDDENINCELPNGDGNGRIYIQMDLQNTLSPVQLLTKATTGTLPALQQDEDVNFTDGIFEVEIATYTATATAVQVITQTAPVIKAANTKVLTFVDVPITWYADSTYEGYGYGYKGTMTCAGVTADYSADITPSPEMIDSGIYAQFNFTGTNEVYIYASEEGASTCPVVIATKVR